MPVEIQIRAIGLRRFNPARSTPFSHQRLLKRLVETSGFEGPKEVPLIPSADPRTTMALSVSPNGLLAATGHGDHTIRIWDVPEARELHCLSGHSRTLWTIHFHPTIPNLIVSGCIGGVLIAWDAEDGRPVWEHAFEDGQVFSIAFHPFGHLLMVGVYYPKTRSSHLVLFPCHLHNTVSQVMGADPHICYRGEHPIKCIQFHPLGQMILVSEAQRQTLERNRGDVLLPSPDAQDDGHATFITPDARDSMLNKESTEFASHLSGAFMDGYRGFQPIQLPPWPCRNPQSAQLARPLILHPSPVEHLSMRFMGPKTPIKPAGLIPPPHPARHSTSKPPIDRPASMRTTELRLCRFDAQQGSLGETVLMVPEAVVYSDSSCDLSPCGRMLVVLVAGYEGVAMPPRFRLLVVSLQSDSLGQTLFSRTVCDGICRFLTPIAASFSPTSANVLVAYTSNPDPLDEARRSLQSAVQAEILAVEPMLPRVSTVRGRVASCNAAVFFLDGVALGTRQGTASLYLMGKHVEGQRKIWVPLWTEEESWWDGEIGGEIG